MSPHAQKHFAREKLTEHSYKRDNPDYKHSQGYKRESLPVQALAKHASRLAYAKAHRHIRQRGRVFSYSEDLPME